MDAIMNEQQNRGDRGGGFRLIDRSFLILFLVFLYLTQGLFLLNPRLSLTVWKEPSKVMLLISVITTVILGLVSLIMGFARCSRNLAPVLPGDALLFLVMKLIMIPFYLLNFLVWSGLALAMAIVPGAQFFLLALPLVGVVTFLILLPFSAHAAAAMEETRRQGLVPGSRTIVLGLLQFVFVLDVVAYCVFYANLHKALKGRNSMITPAEGQNSGTGL